MTTEKQPEIQVEVTELEKKIMDAIVLLEPIPEDHWCVDVTTNETGQHCFIGHLIDHGKTSWNELNTKSSKILGLHMSIINNGLESKKLADSYFSEELNQMIKNGMRKTEALREIMSLPTPKQRTLAGLRLLLKTV